MESCSPVWAFLVLVGVYCPPHQKQGEKIMAYPRYHGILAEVSFTRNSSGVQLKGYLIGKGSTAINPPQEITLNNIKHLSLDLGIVETLSHIYTIRTYKGTGKMPPEGIKNIPEEDK
jgi:hypothetical protein